jgi:peptidoglycan/LPS O-acetylase OafA/YrhL
MYVMLAWLSMPPPLAGQHQPAVVQGQCDAAAPCTSLAMTSSIELDADRRPSTGVERFLWGVIPGLLLAIGANQAWDESGPATATAYVLGTAVGVGLVTGAREGWNPFGLTVGLLSGTAVGLLLLAGGEALSEHADGSSSWSQWAGAIGFMVAVPLGAAIGHATIRSNRDR